MLDPKSIMLEYYGTDDRKKLFSPFEEDLRSRAYFLGKDLVKIPFPYYAPDNSLPPIPTAKDVEEARPRDYDVYSGSGGHVFRVNGVYAVKFSMDSRVLQVKQISL